jgi:hypothetical protein
MGCVVFTTTVVLLVLLLSCFILGGLHYCKIALHIGQFDLYLLKYMI